MLQIAFNKNYNGKLFNDHFCDVRIANEYFYNGQHFEVMLKGTSMGAAQVVSVRPFPYSKITDSLSYQVVGKPAAYLAEIIKRMNGNKIESDIRLLHIVFAYTARNYENQTHLLNSWWDERKPEGYEMDR